MGSLLDLTALLQAAQSADAGVRGQAEAALKQLQEAQHDSFLLSLSAELASTDKHVDARRLAGLILKNTLDAKDEARKAALAQAWTAMDQGIKQQIKNNLLGTLGTQGEAGHTAALVVAKVAAIELPVQQWPELIGTLLGNMAVQPPSSALRQHTLEALGYTCEELGYMDEDYLQQPEVNAILTAVVQGMGKKEADGEVRHAATVALLNALEFAHTNFGNEKERTYIMQMVCEGTVAENPRVRQASWECLVRIAQAYYSTLPNYMTEIFKLTQRTVKVDEEEVALQALEFWCTICEEEKDRGEAATTQDDSEVSSGDTNHHFIPAALPHLAPLLLEQLTKQEEGQETEDGTWNLSMAGGTCLGLCSSVAGDAVVPLVMPYVQSNIQAKDGAESWRQREAATLAFGSILEGPTVQTLSQLVHSGLPFLLAALKDPSAHVRDTTAWTIGRIFEFVHGPDFTPPLIGPNNLPQIIAALLEAIRDAPHIAEKVCYAFSQLAAGFDEAGGTSPLSPYFQDVVQALLETASRPVEVSEAVRVQTQAFEAINEVVRSSAADTTPLVVQLIPVMLGQLGSTLQMSTQSAEAAEKQSELQGLLCGVLQVIVQKLSKSEAAKAGVVQYADQIMAALLAVFGCHTQGVHEEAMLAVGALTDACGRNFIKYMQLFFPVLQMGLAHHQDWQVCVVTVGVLGDISRAVEEQIFPFCDPIMQTLLQNLQSLEVHRKVKPQILQAFGDLALATGDKFENYLPHVLTMLQGAMGLSVQQQQASASDEDLADYNNSLRIGILEAWAGAFNGLSREKADQYLKPYAPQVLEFAEAIFSDTPNQDGAVWKAAVALLGDVASLSGVGPLFQQPFVQQFVQQAAGESGMEDVANWASQMIGKAMRGG